MARNQGSLFAKHTWHPAQVVSYSFLRELWDLKQPPESCPPPKGSLYPVACKGKTAMAATEKGKTRFQLNETVASHSHSHIPGLRIEGQGYGCCPRGRRSTALALLTRSRPCPLMCWTAAPRQTSATLLGAYCAPGGLFPVASVAEVCAV